MSLEAFNKHIKLIKDKEEQDWPEGIVGIINELEAEGSMCKSGIEVEGKKLHEICLALILFKMQALILNPLLL